MMAKPLRKLVLTIAVLSIAASVCSVAEAQVKGTTLDEAAAPGTSYDKAEFRLWYPDDAGPLKAVVILVPGSNGDGRAMAEDPLWQTFAVRHRLALVGCRFTDKPHEQSFIEQYVDVSHGTGQALLDALATFARRSKHSEFAGAPLLLWGMSAGGEFNYEFVAWKPERVVGFVVNKGGLLASLQSTGGLERCGHWPRNLGRCDPLTKNRDFWEISRRGLFNPRVTPLLRIIQPPGYQRRGSLGHGRHSSLRSHSINVSPQELAHARPNGAG